MKKTIIVIGAGPSGIIASATASIKNNNVILIEKNERIGKKMLITGNGRCNITNLSSIEGLMDNVIRNRYFLYSAFYTFNNRDIINLLEKYNVKIKIEDNNKCFPITDKSIDVIKALEKYLIDNNVNLKLNSKVYKIDKNNEKFLVSYSKDCKNYIIEADKIIIATGGKSYPSTGSTGDGYKFVKKLGHTITPLIPSMVPINIKENWIKNLKGISLKNIKLLLINNKKEIASEIGDIIFTHYGISGPGILRLTCANNRLIYMNKADILKLDLFPNLNIKELDNKLIKAVKNNPNKNILNILSNMLPYNFILAILKKLTIAHDIKGNQLTKEDRRRICEFLKEILFNIGKLRPIEEAYVTSGGIDISEIDPSSMESMMIKDLFFCGEVLDVDAYTGGFNLQIAYSTGYLAGNSC